MINKNKLAVSPDFEMSIVQIDFELDEEEFQIGLNIAQARNLAANVLTVADALIKSTLN